MAYLFFIIAKKKYAYIKVKLPTKNSIEIKKNQQREQKKSYDFATKFLFFNSKAFP